MAQGELCGAELASYEAQSVSRRHCHWIPFLAATSIVLLNQR
jgi:hypothetical protein